MKIFFIAEGPEFGILSSPIFFSQDDQQVVSVVFTKRWSSKSPIWIRISPQELSKIAQSGHTALDGDLSSGQ